MTEQRRKHVIEKIRTLKTIQRVPRKHLMITVLSGTKKRQAAAWKILKRRGFKNRDNLKVLIKNGKHLPFFVLRDSLFMLLKSYYRQFIFYR